MNQRVKIDLSNLTVGGVQFSQNVSEALGTILRQARRLTVSRPGDGVELE